MKVKLTMSRGGPAGTQNAGDVVDVANAEAKRMIEAGQAVPVRAGTAAVERTTAAPAPRKAAAKKAPAKKPAAK